jgi:cell division protein FtsB
MREFREKRTWKRLIYGRYTVIALFLLSLFIAHATWKVYQREVATAQERVKAERNLVMAQSNNALLKRQIAELETPAGVDEEIRKTYSVSKEGEGVAVIIPQLLLLGPQHRHKPSGNRGGAELFGFFK